MPCVDAGFLMLDAGREIKNQETSNQYPAINIQ